MKPFPEKQKEGGVTTIESIEQNFRFLQQAPGKLYGTYIRKAIEAGTVSWEELSFTEGDLVRAEQAAVVRGIEQNFRWLQQAHDLLEDPGNLYGTYIRKAIEAGTVSWEELSFTEGDLVRAEQAAVVRGIEQKFELLQQAPGKFYGTYIRKAIEAGTVSWEELSFTEGDLVRAEQAAVVRGKK